jgi:hypothetical protein
MLEVGASTVFANILVLGDRVFYMLFEFVRIWLNLFFERNFSKNKLNTCSLLARLVPFLVDVFVCLA